MGTLLSRTDQLINDARELGETALRSTKEDRELDERLSEIDAVLANFDEDCNPDNFEDEDDILLVSEKDFFDSTKNN